MANLSLSRRLAELERRVATLEGHNEFRDMSDAALLDLLAQWHATDPDTMPPDTRRLLSMWRRTDVGQWVRTDPAPTAQDAPGTTNVAAGIPECHPKPSTPTPAPTVRPLRENHGRMIMATRGRPETTIGGPQELKVRRFAALVFEQGDIRRAAKAQGVPERTAYRWAGTDTFRDALISAQHESLRDATRGLSAGAVEAVEVLRAIVRNPDTAEGVRVRAALGILDAALKLATHVEVEARLLALEAAMASPETPN